MPRTLGTKRHSKGEVFWERAAHHLSQRPLPHPPLLILADTNTDLPLEAADDLHYGTHQSRGNKKDHFHASLHNRIVNNNVFIPSTFSQHHSGDRHTHDAHVAHSILYDFNTAVKKADHFPVYADIKALFQSTTFTQDQKRLDRRWIDTRDPRKLEQAHQNDSLPSSSQLGK